MPALNAKIWRFLLPLVVLMLLHLPSTVRHAQSHRFCALVLTHGVAGVRDRLNTRFALSRKHITSWMVLAECPLSLSRLFRFSFLWSWHFSFLWNSFVATFVSWSECRVHLFPPSSSFSSVRMKIHPYHPVLSGFLPQESLSPLDISNLYDWGFNFIRSSLHAFFQLTNFCFFSFFSDVFLHIRRRSCRQPGNYVAWCHAITRRYKHDVYQSNERINLESRSQRLKKQ